jgi:hypothetical protein
MRDEIKKTKLTLTSIWLERKEIKIKMIKFKTNIN